MTDTRGPIPSVVDRTKPVAAGAPVVAVHFLRDRAVFVLGEEALLFVAPDGAEQRVAVHGGGILASRATARASSPAAMTARSSRPTRRAKAKRSQPTRSIAGSTGSRSGPTRSRGRPASRSSCAPPKVRAKSLDLPSSAGGLAFSPKGLRVAAAHYGGVTLWFPNAQPRRRPSPGRARIST